MKEAMGWGRDEGLSGLTEGVRGHSEKLKDTIKVRSGRTQGGAEGHNEGLRDAVRSQRNH